jgi:hypothetical protein
MTWVAVVRSEKLIAKARGQFKNPDEGESPQLEAATKQRLMKTEKTLCVLQLQFSLECVNLWDCRSYLQLPSVCVHYIGLLIQTPIVTQSRDNIYMTTHAVSSLKLCMSVGMALRNITAFFVNDSSEVPIKNCGKQQFSLKMNVKTVDGQTESNYCRCSCLDYKNVPLEIEAHARSEWIWKHGNPGRVQRGGGATGYRPGSLQLNVSS